VRILISICIALVLILLLGDPAWGARRAVVIGINQYAAPPGEVRGRATGGRDRWRDLRGAVHDAKAMRAILVARYGFRREDVRLLLDTDATRANILGSVKEHLIARSKPGDVSLFFYAGHGSQLLNPRSRETDRLDETIVPADSNRGAPDIRDKELRGLFNDVLDRGAELVAIFDSCSSGSITRSIRPISAARFLPPATLPSVATPGDEAIDSGPPPEQRGALILTATEPGQTARETVDDRGLRRGAFSFAFLNALREAPPNEPVERLYLRTRATMAADQRGQNPVLAATEARRRRPLLGSAAPQLSGEVVAAVAEVDESNEVTLEAGLAAGLNEGSELVRAGDGAPIRLRVVSVTGLDRSTARVVSGDIARLRHGDLVRLDRWAAPRGSRLRVALPESAPDAAALRRLAKSLEPLRSAQDLTWVEDPSEQAPTHRVLWDGAEWWLESPERDPLPLGAQPTLKDIRAALERREGEPPRLFVSLPPPQALRSALESDALRSRGSIELVDESVAHYALVGRAEGGTLSYAWVRPGSATSASRVPGLPPRTEWIALGEPSKLAAQSPARLRDACLRLAKIRAWLTLESPPDTGRFPYHLVLRNAVTGRFVGGGVALDGDAFQLVLQREPRASGAAIPRRYVYVFTIDSHGRQTLLFPQPSAGNAENRLPLGWEKDGAAGGLIQLGDVTVRVGPPYGSDTFIMITTEQPLADPRVLEGEAIRTRSVRSPSNASVGPLAELLRRASAHVQEAIVATPTTWSIERLTIRSAPR
jgi:hypothetical protein